METMEIHEGEEEEAMDLPPGFRFHPTDEELITNYLIPKVLDNSFVARAIGEVDLNKCEPWQLHRHAKLGENEWYFFCVRDRKYPTGLRTNRATEAGYWKATGKDKDIFRDKSIVGMKKTLVFYKGRPPKGEKLNWVMHEYRLHGNSLLNLPSNAKNEWAICRVFHKNGGKKVHFMDLLRSESTDIEYHPSENLPPLMDSSPYNTNTNNGVIPHVPCFSNPKITSQTSNYNNFNHQPFIHNPFHSDPSNSAGNYYLQSHTSNFPGNYLRAVIENHGTEPKQSMKTEEVNYSASQDTSLSNDMNAETSSVVSNYDMGSRLFNDRDCPSTSGGPVGLETLWNY